MLNAIDFYNFIERFLILIINRPNNIIYYIRYHNNKKIFVFRPLSSMSPTIVLDDKNRVVAVAGASGGTKIITTVAQVILTLSCKSKL